MDKEYREEHPEESFDGGYHLWAHEQHKSRVAKNPDRIAYAIQQFEAHGIEYSLKMNRPGISIAGGSRTGSCSSSTPVRGKYRAMTGRAGFMR